MKTEAIIRFERTFLRRDGTTVPVEVSASRLRPGYFQTVVRNISERSQAALEKAFKEIQVLKDELYEENIALLEEIVKTSMFEEIIGVSPALQAVLSRVSKVALTDSTVLITGETGTGEELIARAIHKGSQRSSRAFVNMNCSAIPRDLIASELFGHEKGAFTGALRAKELLHKTELPISEIALRSGFSSQSHFTISFRRVAGSTPKDFRATI